MADTLKQAIDELSNAPKTNIKGKQYSQVATRVEVFRKHFGLDYGVTTELLPVPDESLVRVRATITNADGAVLATGMAEEDRRNGNINKTAALENCETSAIGRALAAFGLHGGEYATADEVQGKVAAQDQSAKKPERPERGAKDSSGQWTRHSVKKDMRGFLKELNACGDYDELIAFLAANKQLMQACSELAPDWWREADPDYSDAPPFREVIEGKKHELYEAAQRKAEYEPAQ